MKNSFARSAAFSLFFGVCLSFFTVGVFWDNGGKDTLVLLADAMTVPAVLLIGAGVLSLAKWRGVLDIFSYALHRFFGLVFLRNTESCESFYDFRQGRSRGGDLAALAPLLFGSLFLLCAAIFTVMYSLG